MHYRPFDFSVGRNSGGNKLSGKEIRFNGLLSVHVKMGGVLAGCGWRLINGDGVSDRAPFPGREERCGGLGVAVLKPLSSEPLGGKGHATCHWRDKVLQVVNTISDMIYCSESSANGMAAAFEWIILLFSSR